MNNNKTKSWSPKKILLAAVVIILGWILFFFLFNDYTSESGDINGGIYDSNDFDDATPSPLPSPSPVPLNKHSTITELQTYLLALIGNPAYSYGSICGDIELKENALNRIVNISVDGAKEIDINKADTGDVAICGSTIGICVGRYNNAPIFAYISDLPTTLLPDGGIYFGYSLENKDQLLCGLYPLPFSRCYDTNPSKDNGSGTNLAEKIQTLNKQAPWYSDLLYECSREIALCNTESLLSRIPYDSLHSQNLTILENEYSTILKYLYVSNDEEKNAKDYRFLPKHEFEFADYSILRVSVLSLKESAIFEQSLEYDITLYRDGKFLICPIIDATSYVGVCGLAPKERLVSTTDKEGNEIISSEEIVYGYTVDEYGNNIYVGLGFTIYLDEDTNSGEVSTNDH